MQHRAPSVQLAPRAANEIRRRSGGQLRSSVDEKDASQIYLTEQDPDQDQAEDTNENTVLLVKHSQVHLAPSAILPFAPTFEREHHRHIWDGKPVVPFSPVSLTPLPPPPSPRLGPPPRIPTVSSVHTITSLVPTLPTPDFGNGSTRRVPGAFLRGLSFAPFRIPTTTFFSVPDDDTANPAIDRLENVHGESDRPDTTTLPPRPASARTDSEATTVCSTLGSESSDWTSISVDGGRRFHSMTAVGTTSKFTHKWPVPYSLRYVDPNDLIDGALASEEGRGGVRWVPATLQTRWTLSKWCLLFSVITVLVYGTAGLMWAVMTWSKGQARFYDGLSNHFVDVPFLQRGTMRTSWPLQTMIFSSSSRWGPRSRFLQPWSGFAAFFWILVLSLRRTRFSCGWHCCPL